MEPTLEVNAALLAQLAALAEERALSTAALAEQVLSAFVAAQGQPPATINQGDIFWVAPGAGNGELGQHRHPYVVVQDDLFNHSRVASVVVCALTSDLRSAGMPGNLLLEPGEANLPRHSIVVGTKISALPKAQLGAYIGSLSAERVAQILTGLRFVQRAFWAR